jgi:hypothetical protein
MADLMEVRRDPGREFAGESGRWGSLSLCQQVAQQLPHNNRIAWLRCVGRDMEYTGFKRLDLLRRLVTFQHKQHLTGANELPLSFQPFAERPFVHRPAETGYNDFRWHGITR